ncbi:MAG TPA: DUF4350 domain-containing protein [Armatimonadota bacterium]|jgi:hypothetical protein
MMGKRGELIVLLLLLAFIVTVTVLSRRDDYDKTQSSPETAVHSSYVTLPPGYKALSLTLKRLGYPVHTLIRPYGVLPPQGMLIVADPYRTALSPYEARTLLRWVAQGNIALIALEYHPECLAAFEPEKKPAATARPQKVTPAETPKLDDAWTARFAGETMPAADAATAVDAPLAALRKLSLQVRSRARFPATALLPAAVSARVGGARPLYRDARGVVAAYSSIGKGQIIWCASPWSFSNTGIAQGQNLDVLLALADARPGGPVIFDEYHHGMGAGMTLWDLAPTRTKWGVAQLALALALLFLTLAWRFGPPRLPADERYTRSRAEYLTSMAMLLQRAKATHVARNRLTVLLQREVGRRLGITAHASPEQLLAANAVQPVVEQDGLRRVLEELTRLNAQERPAQEDVLRLTREVHRLLQHKLQRPLAT